MLLLLCVFADGRLLCTADGVFRAVPAGSSHRATNCLQQASTNHWIVSVDLCGEPSSSETMLLQHARQCGFLACLQLWQRLPDVTL